jgi:hypothetical protein
MSPPLQVAATGCWRGQGSRRVRSIGVEFERLFLSPIVILIPRLGQQHSYRADE